MTVSGRHVLTCPSETIRARYILHNLNGNSPVNRLMRFSHVSSFYRNLHFIFTYCYLAISFITFSDYPMYVSQIKHWIIIIIILISALEHYYANYNIELNVLLYCNYRNNMYVTNFNKFQITYNMYMYS